MNQADHEARQQELIDQIFLQITSGKHNSMASELLLAGNSLAISDREKRIISSLNQNQRSMKYHMFKEKIFLEYISKELHELNMARKLTQQPKPIPRSAN